MEASSSDVDGEYSPVSGSVLEKEGFEVSLQVECTAKDRPGTFYERRFVGSISKKEEVVKDDR